MPNKILFVLFRLQQSVHFGYKLFHVATTKHVMKSKSNAMRNVFFALLLLAPTFVFSQTNIGALGFNYSALVRDTAGRVQPLKDVKLRFTLLIGQNGTSANSPWIETQTVKTDAYGFVNVTIGNGTRQSGVTSFADVDFTLTNYWIVIEVFNDFTKAYDPLAKQAFQAVPYAKVAGSLVGSSALPPGTVVAFAGDAAQVPKGWLLCDGRELDNTDTKYINLFNAIKYSWGTINNANKFNIPDTRGLFLRGVSSSSGNDPDSDLREASNVNGNEGNKVGSKQMDAIRKHQHRFKDTYWSSQNCGGGGVLGAGSTEDNDNGLCRTEDITGSGIDTNGADLRDETRPKNVYVNYIIKL